MSYILRNGLSFCQIDGTLVFLDIDNDRYFRLPNQLERTFVESSRNGFPMSPQIKRLADMGILIENTGNEFKQPVSMPEEAFRSAIEQGTNSKNPNMKDLVDVFSTVFSTQWLLRKNSLKHALNLVVSRQEQSTPESRSDPSNFDDHEICSAARIFIRTRLYVPIEPCCLLDSLAMVKFLARRSLRANIVFGVTRDPFSAHCWVQAKDLVLNDTVGATKAYVPIRVC